LTSPEAGRRRGHASVSSPGTVRRRRSSASSKRTEPRRRNAGSLGRSSLPSGVCQRVREGGASAVALKERTATDRTGALTRAHGSTRYRASLPCLVPSSRRIEGEEVEDETAPLETETIRVRAKRACPISGSSSPVPRS
jgi:hypothetical protein